MHPGDLYRIAARVASALSGTCLEDIEQVCDRLEIRSLTGSEETEFLRHLDRLVFRCAQCEWWHEQSENATPDGAQWICRECSQHDD